MIISLFQKAAESHLPTLETKEGIYISMDDMDGVHVWNFKYRYIYYQILHIYKTTLNMVIASYNLSHKKGD